MSRDQQREPAREGRRQPTPEPVASRSERLFGVLLVLFPRPFRRRFGCDMRELFRDQARSARSHDGAGGILRLWLRTIPSLLRAALMERHDGVRDALRYHRSHSTVTKGDSMLETIASDLRFAGRMLRKHPVFTAVAVLVISLGTGAVTTIYSAMNAVMLRPLPGTSGGDRLVLLERRTSDLREGASASYAYFDYLRTRARTFDEMGAWSKAEMSIARGGEGHAAYGNVVSGNYFSVLGVLPALGRFFLPEEDRTPLSHPVIIVSHEFWQSRLAGDTTVVGGAVTVNGHPYTLIGVAPPGFRGVFTPLRIDAWAPLMMQAQLRPGRDLDDARWLWLIGRLDEGVGRDAARRELVALTGAYIAEASEPAAYRTHTGIRMTDLTGLPDDARRAFMGFAGIFLGAAALVLLIAAVNVASMLSARAVARRREMALRTALGAARSRLVRQLLTESLLLFLLGAIGGVAVAWIATGTLEQIRIPGEAPISLELSPDPRVLAFALLVSLMTGLIFGLAPALQGASRDITQRLRDDTAASSARRTLAGNALIVGQMAFSLVLLVSAGLFVRALDLGARMDPGFDTAGVVTASLNTESWGYDEAKGRAFYTALRERLEGTAGVSAVTYGNVIPLTMAGSGDVIRVAGAEPSASDGEGRLSVKLATVDAGYFDVLRIPIVRGRAIDATDVEGAPRVAVVNETLARQLWPDGSAIGRTFDYHGTRVTIVGVARDAKYDNLAERTPPFLYLSAPEAWNAGRVLMVRTASDPTQLALAIQRAVHAIDPVLPRPVVRTLREETSIVLLPQRVAAAVTGVLGGVGLLLATVGLYGIISYSVGRRTREMGVRVALGAERAALLGMVVGEGMRLAAVGIVVGLLLAGAATRLIRGLLFTVSPLDVTTYAAMTAVLVAVALLASYLPARRAAGADPMTALRSE